MAIARSGYGIGQLRRLLDRLSEMNRDMHKTNAQKQKNKLELKENKERDWIAAAA